VSAKSKGSIKSICALITGAASPIGRAIALVLAGRGVNIVAHYNTSAKKAGDLCSEIETTGVRAWALHADFKNEKALGSLIQRSKKVAGRLDILVNNASLYTVSRLTDLGYADFVDNMRVNTWAPLLLGRAFAATARKGVIVNLLDSRIVGYDRDHAGYILSKHTLDLLTRMMAMEFAPHFRVNAVAPGLICTDRAKERADGKLARSLPLGRFGSPKEVASAALLLIENRFITGQTIFVDGGRQVRENGWRP
jgi:pteridine reductase